LEAVDVRLHFQDSRAFVAVNGFGEGKQQAGFYECGAGRRCACLKDVAVNQITVADSILMCEPIAQRIRTIGLVSDRPDQ